MRNDSSQNGLKSPLDRGKHFEGDEYIVTGEIPAMSSAECERLTLMFGIHSGPPASREPRGPGLPWDVAQV